ncbi:MAG: spore germination protein [Solirubrobacterales bacterium]
MTFDKYSKEIFTKIKLCTCLNENIDIIKKVLGINADLIIRNLVLGRKEPISSALIYFENMVSKNDVDSNIMNSLIVDSYKSGMVNGSEIISEIFLGNVITNAQTKIVYSLKELTEEIASGNIAILFDDLDKILIIDVKGYSYREISESVVEPTVKGPRDSFIEVLGINLSLIRRRISNADLIFESLTVGSISHTKICIGYIRGLCPGDLIDEIRTRINKMNADGIIDSNYISEYINDNKFSVFSQIRDTDRPDIACSALMEGRAVILVDNTPITLILPGEFFSLIQSADDYYNRYTFSSLARLLRYFSMSIALVLPALYISVVNFHQELIPTRLLESIITARAGVPLPNYAEAILMETAFEILREAGVRLPRPVGPAISIVGGLVIGQAAVQAAVVSPLMVIVVSLTAIAGFTIPQYNISLSVRILRFALMILSSIFGLYGLMLGLLFLLVHMCSLKSFGTPYLYPLTPFDAPSFKDTVLRFPLWAFSKQKTIRRISKYNENWRNNP